MSQRDSEYGLEKAVGQVVLSKSTVSEWTESLNQEYEAFRTRDLRGDDVAYLFLDVVYEPLRGWGRKTGVLCVWAICVDGRKVWLSLSTANSESQASGLEVLRDLLKRGLQTPVTMTIAGAVGWTKAIAAIGSRSLRSRWWFPKRQNLRQKVPPQAWPAVKALVVDICAMPLRWRPNGGGKRVWPSITSTFPTPVAACATMPGPALISSPSRRAINSTCALRP